MFSRSADSSSLVESGQGPFDKRRQKAWLLPATSRPAAARGPRLDPGADQQSEQDQAAAAHQRLQHDVALQLAHAIAQLRDLLLQRLVARFELLVLFVICN